MRTDKMVTVAPLALVIFTCLVLGGFLSWVLVDHDYEAMYLGLGTLAVTGEIGLYQDDMTGHWMPLPFYVFGLSQLLSGPNLLSARLLSIGVTVLVVVLMFLIAQRLGGALAGAVACGLFCTHGLVLGYFATAHFASLVAVLHLLGIYVLFRTDWPHRDLLAMAVFSVLFLVKPHYWPTIPFVLIFLLWRAPSRLQRLSLCLVAGVVPLLFFASNREHWKILAYAPVVRRWVEPMGYYSWHTLIEDPEAVWTSDYASIHWRNTLHGQLVAMLGALGFLVKRYALWAGLLAVLGVLTLGYGDRQDSQVKVELRTAVRFTFLLFCYLVTWQFVIVGPYIKQSFAYVGAIAPLLAMTIGYLFARLWEEPRASRALRWGVVGMLTIVLLASPWVHRSHYLPRRISMGSAEIPALRIVSQRLSELIPPGQGSVFLLGDPLPVFLAGRRPYLRQAHDHLMMLTSVRDRQRYARGGMWGASEIEEWLGTDARYAVIEPNVLDFYAGRKPYAEAAGRIGALLARHFTLVETVRAGGDHVLRVYRRNTI